jgi:acyl carrier protein
MNVDTRTRIIDEIFRVVDTLNAQVEEPRRILKSPDTVLLGEGGCVDSLGLVNLLTGVEERIDEVFASTISLFDSALLSDEDGALSTIGSLADYIARHLGEHPTRT